MMYKSEQNPPVFQQEEEEEEEEPLPFQTHSNVVDSDPQKAKQVFAVYHSSKYLLEHGVATQRFRLVQ
jgi:hypothetical protein